MHTIVGIDPSLASTGIAVLGWDRKISLHRIRTTGKKGDTWATRAQRIRTIVEQVCEVVPEDSVVTIESPSYGSASTSTWDRAGVWWGAWEALSKKQCVLLPISPSQRMKYATGSGRADKDTVLAHTVRRYQDIEVTNNDEADALVLLAMGARLVGAPLECEMPKAHLAALDKLWDQVPDRLPEA